MRGNIKATELMHFFRCLLNCTAATHSKDTPFHINDIIVPSNHWLVAESFWVVYTLRHRLVHPVRHRQGRGHRIEEANRMHFFRRLHLKARKKSDASAARTFCHRRSVASRLMICQSEPSKPRLLYARNYPCR